ncbi:FtsX-like permease family protein [Candidatus Lokiarchaeum ossiferum]|uniref:FtsX-like permease family protein n=1 Tax=Candidatus Lokiarchaeum ossiferum TaxID=2951803 RepID=UPI00352EAC10
MQVKKKKNYLKKLTLWYILTNRKKYKKLLRIYSITLIFIVISVNLGNSYEFSEKIQSSLYHGEGEMMEFQFHDDYNLSSILNCTKPINDELSVDHINGIYHTQRWFQAPPDWNYEFDIKITSLDPYFYSYYEFSWVNYTLLMQDSIMLDRWFTGGTVQEIMEKMKRPNSILLPEKMLKGGLQINDTLNFTVKTDNNNEIQKKGIIIGTYNNFPVSHMEGQTGSEGFAEIYMSLDLLRQAKIETLEMVFYPSEELITIDRPSVHKTIIDYFPFDYSVRNLDIQRYHNKFDGQIFEFFELEGYLLAIFAFLAFFMYSQIENKESITEISILRSKGLLERDLMKSSVAGIGLLALIASILALIGAIGIKPFILVLNLLRNQYGFEQCYLYFHFDWLQFGLIIIMGGILFTTASFGCEYWHIRSTRESRKLEMMMRN